MIALIVALWLFWIGARTRALELSVQAAMWQRWVKWEFVCLNDTIDVALKTTRVVEFIIIAVSTLLFVEIQGRFPRGHQQVAFVGHLDVLSGLKDIILDWLCEDLSVLHLFVLMMLGWCFMICLLI